MPIPKLGDIIEAYCGRCKLNLDTSVAAVVGEEIVSVVCRTCDEKQKFRPPRPEKTVAPLASRTAAGGGRRVVDVSAMSKSNRSSAGKSRTATRRPVRTDEHPRPAATRRQRSDSPEIIALRAMFQRWDQATAGVDSRFARPHREEEAYDPGEAILHKMFGMGIVEDRTEDGTLTVLFRNGVHSLPSTPPERLPPPVLDLDQEDPEV